MKAVGPELAGRRRAACMCTLEPMNIPATDCLLPARRPTPRAYLTGSSQAAPTNFLRKAPFAIKIVQRAARMSKRVGENTGTVCEPRTARPRDPPVPCSASVVRPRTSRACFGARTWHHLDGPTNASSALCAEALLRDTWRQCYSRDVCVSFPSAAHPGRDEALWARVIVPESLEWRACVHRVALRLV